MIAFKFVEQHGRRLAQNVDQYIQAAPVGHTDDDFFDTRGRRHATWFRAAGGSGCPRLQAKTFSADITGVQVFLEAFGRGQHLQDAQAVLIVYVVESLRSFQPCLIQSRFTVSTMCMYSIPMLLQ